MPSKRIVTYIIKPEMLSQVPWMRPGRQSLLHPVLPRSLASAGQEPPGACGSGKGGGGAVGEQGVHLNICFGVVLWRVV